MMKNLEFGISKHKIMNSIVSLASRETRIYQ